MSLPQFEPDTFLSVEQLNAMVDKINSLEQEVNRLNGARDSTAVWSVEHQRLTPRSGPSEWSVQVDGVQQEVESIEPVTQGIVKIERNLFIPLEVGKTRLRVKLKDGRETELSVSVERDIA